MRSELRSSHESQDYTFPPVSTKKKKSDKQNSDKLTKDEVRIIRGALDLRDKTAQDLMTPWTKCFTLPFSAKMDLETMTRIFESGHSRIPIWREEEDDVIGMILVKQLILLAPQDSVPLSSLHIHRVPMVSSSMSLFELLTIFRSGRSHLAIVVRPQDHVTPLGVITLEDIIEALIQGEILDETDRYTKKGAERAGHRRSRTWSISNDASNARLTSSTALPVFASEGPRISGDSSEGSSFPES
jgi:CBS domain containing-hemolysin-like protein